MPSSGEEDFFYNRRGEKVQLIASPDAFSVRFARGVRSDSDALSSKSRKFFRKQCKHVDFLPHYGLQVFQRKAADGEGEQPASDELKQAVERLNGEDATEFASPVYRNPLTNEPVFVTNLLAVEFKPTVTTAQINALQDKIGGTVVGAIGYAQSGPGVVIEAPTKAGPSGAIELSKRYFESGLAVYANPDLIRKRVFREDATLFARRARHDGMPATWLYQDKQWHIDKAKIVGAWALTMGDPGVVVCIADDGLDVDHPAFANKIVGQYDFEADIPDASPKSELDKHGTACAGVATAAGDMRGVAPACKLLAVRTPAYLGAIDEANMFQWIADNNADVLSCSWGPEDGAGAYSPLDNILSAIRYCATRGRGGKGIPIFWAAGNGDESMMDDGYASNPDVMAVAASTERDVKAYYSDFGPGIWVSAPSSGRQADGERKIWTVDRMAAEGYNPGDVALGDAAGLYTNSFGGTSAAAPLAAGVAALMLSVNRGLVAADVRQILAETADKIGPAADYDATGHSANFGFGRINAAAAVARAKIAQNGATSGDTPPSAGTPPTITGPSRAVRSDADLIFACSGGENPFFAIEVATAAELFNNALHGMGRNGDNFYATWQGSGFLSGSTYILPSAVWSRLNAADRLYYRLISSASSTVWQNAKKTTADAQAAAAPFVTIGDEADEAEPQPSQNSSIQAPPSAGRSNPPPTFLVVPIGGYYAVEVASDALLFDKAHHGAERNAGNFFASWQVSGLLSRTNWVLPLDAWNALKASPRLYYRAMVSDSPNAWVNPRSTTPDALADRAPYIQLLDALEPPLTTRFLATRRVGLDRAIVEPEAETLTRPEGAMPARGGKEPKGKQKATQARESRDAMEGRLTAVSATGTTAEGPETYDRATLTGPAFLLSFGSNKEGSLEIVTDPALWGLPAGDPRLTPQNSFSSLGSRPIKASGIDGRPTTYALPLAAWNLLKTADKLFYRALATADPARAAEAGRSYPAAGLAKPPFVQLIGKAGAKLGRVPRRPEEDAWQ
jgi:hypothetical protein